MGPYARRPTTSMSTVMRKWFVYYCIVAPRGSLRHMRRVLLMPSGDTHADAPETQNANYQCFHILFLHCHKRGGENFSTGYGTMSSIQKFPSAHE